MQIIIRNIEEGRNWIYDCDIKGFFDNIPHKKLMKVLNKCIADGTVLDLIWSWLKAGYMEDGKTLRSESGTPQGGVISPLLANIYLNELDWRLYESRIRFVRYADDFLLFATSEEEINRAGRTAREVIEELGLEIAMHKTKVVDFREDDFDFLGFHFNHWRTGKKGNEYYSITPTEKSLKDFRKKIKDRTRKTLTLPKEEWVRQMNEIITGKVNYYLNVHKAIEVIRRHNVEIHCDENMTGMRLHRIDSYCRQRLRLCFIHRHPKIRKAHGMKVKWNNEYFLRIGLIPANWYFYNRKWGYTKEQYLERVTSRNRKGNELKKQRLREKGLAYTSKDRNKKIAYAFAK